VSARSCTRRFADFPRLPLAPRLDEQDGQGAKERDQHRHGQRDPGDAEGKVAELGERQRGHPGLSIRAHSVLLIHR
jgi:hypothetical protein